MCGSQSLLFRWICSAGYSYDGKLNGTQMIYRACCQRFGIEPEASLAALVPPLADNLLDSAGITQPWPLAKHLIQQVYDIAADDARLREQARLARAGQVDFGTAFDQLRKHYPRRREFHNYQVSLPGEAEAARQWLGVLGFGCV